MASINRTLLRVRRGLGLTKRELARRLQREGLPTVSDRTIARWEHGVTPLPAHCKLLARALTKLERAKKN